MDSQSISRISYSILCTCQIAEGIAKVDNLIKGVVKCHKAMVVEPLFANLHDNVCNDETIWQGTPVEKHADQREKLSVKSQVLIVVITGWNELLALIPDEIEEARKSPSPFLAPAIPRKSPGRKSHRKNAGKRAHTDDGEDIETKEKFPRIL